MLISVSAEPSGVCVLSCFSRVQLCASLFTEAHQASLSMGILQARILEWVAMPFSKQSAQPRDWTQVTCIAGRFFTFQATREATNKTSRVAVYFGNHGDVWLVSSCKTEPALGSSVSWQPPAAASLGYPQLSHHGHAFWVLGISCQHRTSLGALCAQLSIFLPLPLSQVSQASWSGSFFCRLLTLPIIFQRHDSEHISYFWHCLCIWFPEDQTNTDVYFSLPCKLMMNKTRHISHSVLLHDMLTIFPRKCFLKQPFVVPFIFACCCWGELLLEHVWHCYVLRRTLMVCFPLLSLYSFCSLFHEVYV